MLHLVLEARLSSCVALDVENHTVKLCYTWYWKCNNGVVVAGAGMIISQGLMRMREYDKIEEAVKRMDWPRIAAGGTLSASAFTAVPSQYSQPWPLQHSQPVPSQHDQKL